MTFSVMGYDLEMMVVQIRVKFTSQPHTANTIYKLISVSILGCVVLLYIKEIVDLFQVSNLNHSFF